MDLPSMVKKYSQPSEATNVTNIIEIHKDITQLGLPSITSAHWILTWMGRVDTQAPPTVLK